LSARSRLPALVATALASLALLLAATPPARADTAFGSDPAQEVTPLSCSEGAPIYLEFLEVFFPYEGTAGSTSCMWSWSNPAIGTDLVPFPPTGGSGTVTSVTLPAMPDPGRMEVVVLTAALSAGSSASEPDFVCCEVKQVGPEFTVSPNQVTTVPLSLHVSATEEADLSNPGETSFTDLVGVSVLSPSASLPIRYTGATSISNADVASAYYPAPGGANAEYKPPFNEYGFQLLARFTVAYDAPPAPAPAPVITPDGGGEAGGGGGNGGGEPAAGGVELRNKVAGVGGDGKTVTLGKATNPPTAATTQKLTALTGGRARASASAAKKPVVYGSGKTAVPAGRSRALKVNLNRRARRLLNRHRKLKARLTLVAVNAKGEKQTVTRTITVKQSKKRGKKGKR
jgi:hypothetical protein